MKTKKTKTKKMLTFWYHPKGQDNNGNCGPTKRTKGWTKVRVLDTGDSERDAARAFNKLPEKVKLRINKKLEQANEISDQGLNEYLCWVAGMAVGFTFGCDQWDQIDNND